MKPQADGLQRHEGKAREPSEGRGGPEPQQPGDPHGRVCGSSHGMAHGCRPRQRPCHGVERDSRRGACPLRWGVEGCSFARLPGQSGAEKVLEASGAEGSVAVGALGGKGAISVTGLGAAERQFALRAAAACCQLVSGPWLRGGARPGTQETHHPPRGSSALARSRSGSGPSRIPGSLVLTPAAPSSPPARPLASPVWS